MRENRTENQELVEIDLWKILLIFASRWKTLLGAALAAAVLVALLPSRRMKPAQM